MLDKLIEIVLEQPDVKLASYLGGLPHPFIKKINLDIMFLSSIVEMYKAV